MSDRSVRFNKVGNIGKEIDLERKFIDFILDTLRVRSCNGR